MLKTKKVVALFMCIIAVFSMCVFSSSAAEVTPYSSATWDEVVSATPAQWPGKVMSFTGSSLIVSCNATATNGSPTTVTIELQKQVLGNMYSTVATGSVAVNGVSAVVFSDVSITPNANYRFRYQVNGSNNPCARVVTVAMS